MKRGDRERGLPVEARPGKWENGRGMNARATNAQQLAEGES